MSRGRSPRDISRAEGNLEVGGDVQPNTSRFEAVYGHSLIINPSLGMYQEIHPCRASSTYSVKINTSLPMMRECLIPSHYRRARACVHSKRRCKRSQHNLNPVGTQLSLVGNLQNYCIRCMKGRDRFRGYAESGLISHVPIAISRERIYRALAGGLMWAK